MKLRIYIVLFVLSSCGYVDRAEKEILPLNVSIKKIRIENFGYTEVRIHEIEEEISFTEIKDFPINNLKQYDWHLVKWHEIQRKEIHNLELILNSIIEDQLVNDHNSIELINQIKSILNLSNIFSSNYYKIYPLSADSVSELDWFIIYILDLSNKRLYTIRNGER